MLPSRPLERPKGSPLSLPLRSSAPSPVAKLLELTLVSCSRLLCPVTSREAWVMMVTDEKIVKPHRVTYVDSACLLIYGLRKAGTTRDILVLVEPTISTKRRT
ncbi:hypothetical protein CYMTET_46960 [Cymbomonas tetramitiformis]|uniref:Uncharacterized protein n=1 Tax=Cymbomonas tetramitiformis TaxID=36881 RepID=A0AAE0EWF7_9CHLO|nr:hypothetical protein CYMTET_46960 [Cymbomonas tetramitiformis]